MPSTAPARNLQKDRAPETPAIGRRLPVVDPAFVTLNANGFAWRDWMVRLPEGAIADDLKEPSLLARVQGRVEKAFRRHDHVYLVAFDESWAADAIVTDANSREVVLSKPRIVAFEKRTRQFFSDDKYGVAWFGNGYAVRRKDDGERVTEVVSSEALAERDLARLYPRPLR